MTNPMIPESELYLDYPMNAVKVIADRIDTWSEDLFVCKRPLRSSDPVQSVGVIPVSWTPEIDTLEMRGRPNAEATLNRYNLGIQAFIKDMDEERGLASHSILSKRIRGMLYRDVTLRASLAALSVSAGGGGERAQRWGVGAQRFLTNEIDGSFLYLSTLEFWLETESY